MRIFILQEVEHNPVETNKSLSLMGYLRLPGPPWRPASWRKAAAVCPAWPLKGCASWWRVLVFSTWWFCLPHFKKMCVKMNNLPLNRAENEEMYFETWNHHPFYMCLFSGSHLKSNLTLNSTQQKLERPEEIPSSLPSIGVVERIYDNNLVVVAVKLWHS